MEVRSQQVIILALSMFIFTLGFGIIIPVMPYYAGNLGATAFELGLLMATFSVMQFVCAPFWGRVSDKIGRKPVMMIGLFGFGFSFTITGLSTALWMLFVSELIGGALSAGIWPSVLAFIADITKPSERGGLMGLMGAASGFGIIFGPAISGVLTIWGLSAPFFGAAGVAIFTMVLTFILLPESRSFNPGNKSVDKISMIAALKTPLGALFLLMLLISFAGACIDGTFAFFVMDKFGLSEESSDIPFFNGSITMTGPGVMAIVFTFIGIMGIIVQGVLVGKLILRFGEEKTIIAGLIIVAVGLGFLIFASGLETLVLYTCLIVVGSGLANPCLNSLVSKGTDSENQGAVMGILGSFSSLGRILGPPVGGFAFNIYTGLPYIGTAFLSIVGAFVISYLAKNGGIVNEKEKVTVKPPIRL
ncbi:MFS transporter [Methanocella sp. CWC-04]|uniref:MFS transporter n=1 Tax=Methanooceanicella nereidis TaxID=2052831 RepID=A0AAP2REI3_9EURY|nr:MFS transporter [Methanocella sp. CWC-04]MCD1295838.1 MFS transporter [Methanocella sp. CWC-04]